MHITAAHKARRDALQDREAGFTLIELLVVVIIIGILAAIAIPIYLGVQNNAKEAATKSDLTHGKTAVVAYAVENNGGVPVSVTDDAVGTVPAAGTNAAATLNRYGWSKSAPNTSTLLYSTNGSGTATSWCITGTSATNTAYRISSNTALAKGTCVALGANAY